MDIPQADQLPKSPTVQRKKKRFLVMAILEARLEMRLPHSAKTYAILVFLAHPISK